MKKSHWMVLVAVIISASLMSHVVFNVFQASAKDDLADQIGELKADQDKDGLSNALETLISLNPNVPDTDDDMISDGDEMEYWKSRTEGRSLNVTPMMRSNCPDQSDQYVIEQLSPMGDFDCDGLPNLNDPDSDSDGSPDGFEILVGTDPANADTDDDGVLDKVDPRPLTNVDNDSDGLADDWEEVNEVLLPMMDDDMDGLMNLEEFKIRSDPRDPTSPGAGLHLARKETLPIGAFHDFYDEDNLEDDILRIRPVTNPRYWRLESYEIFNGNGWEKSPRTYDEYRGEILENEVLDNYYNNGEHYNVIVVGNWSGQIPLPLHTVTMTSTMPTDAPIYKDNKDTFRVDRPLKSYSFTSHIYDYGEDLKQVGTASVSSVYLDLSRSYPSGDTVALAYKIIEDASAWTPYDKTIAIMEYLKANYKFDTKAPTTPKDGSVIDWFLFETKAGYSVQFASSFCVLSRLNAVPCRVVEGFAPGIIKDGVRVVKEGHRHVWAEVALSGIGWVGVETTPINADIGHGIGLGNSGIDINVLQLNNGTVPRDWWFLRDRDPMLGGTGGGTTYGGYFSNDPVDNDGDGIPDEFDDDDDNDGLLDEEEAEIGSNPFSADTDRDGNSDRYEVVMNSDVFSADSDGDGLTDIDELMIYHTNPNKSDTDGDGSCDAQEVRGGSDPTDPLDPKKRLENLDFDNDGTPDWEENLRGTDPTSPDTDMDGLPDNIEEIHGTDPTVADTDGDGLSDAFEINIGTDPCLADTDNDGVIDSIELEEGLDPLESDSDGDGLSDGYEFEVPGLKPLSYDSDFDGLYDGEEICEGLDPLSGDTTGNGLGDGIEVKWNIKPMQINMNRQVMDANQGLVVDLMAIISLVMIAGFFIHRQRQYDEMEALLAKKVRDFTEVDLDQEPDEVRKLIYKKYKKMCALLKEYCISRSDGMTLKEFERIVKYTLEIDGENLGLFMELVQEARYSDHEFEARMKKVIKKYSNRINKSLPEIERPKEDVDWYTRLKQWTKAKLT